MAPTPLQLMQQAIPRHQAGDLAGAEQLYNQVLAIAPADFTARHMLGVIRLQQGRNEEALELIGAALKINPRLPEALSDQAHLLRVLGRLEEALDSIDRSLALKPAVPQALFVRAGLLEQLQRRDEALAAYDRLMAVAPGVADAHNDRAILLRDMRRLEEARADHDKAVMLAPHNADMLYNRGVTLRDMNRAAEALADFDRALILNPGHLPVHFARANALLDLGRFEDALAACDRALALHRDFPDAQNLRGTLLWELKRPREALAVFDQILARYPDYPYARSGQANAVLHLCEWARTKAVLAAAKADIMAGRPIISPLTLLGYGAEPALQLACARVLVQNLMAAKPAPLANGKPYDHGKIRLAYLSHDFQEHPVAAQIAELIERHDRSRFEVIGVSTGPDDAGPMRRRLVAAFDRFHDIQGLGNLEAAQLLRDKEIDVLVDLGGHTHGARLEIFAHRPAPVQATYLGYPGTTGADFIDYILGDAIVTPFDQQSYYSEQIVQLPVSFMANDSTRMVGPAPARAALGLPDQAFVFCCFNKYWKIGAEIFAVWMRLLNQVPGSVLWLKEDGDALAKANLLAAAMAAGIDPARLIFAGRLDNEAHLARHACADLFLDSLPYNAHVTACDALWAGLPVLTVLGDSYPSRVAASLLTAIGLPELVTADLRAYEELALALAQDPARLAALRGKLAQNRNTKPLFDTAAFARHIEAAYGMMLDNAASGSGPRRFAVPKENA